MIKNAGVAAGAGLASALLFAVSAKGGVAAMLLAYFTALPIVIAALGYGHRYGLAGALAGTVATSIGLGPMLGGFYALSFALPAWWLSFLVGSARGAGRPAPADRKPAVAWRSLGLVAIWAVAVSCAAVLAAGAAAVIQFGGYDKALDAVAKGLADALAASPGLSAESESQDFATLLAHVLPLAIAASTCLMLLLNLWLGGRVAQVSHRLPRPWPNVPDGLRLPWPAVLAMGAGAVLAVAAGLDTALGAAGATVAAPLALVFALQGLGTVHVLTRGFPARPAVLVLIYLVTVMLRPSVLALALLGIIDCLGPLRSRKPSPKPPTPRQGV